MSRPSLPLETYERDFHDILALQDDVASAIARQIQFKLGGPEPLPIAKPQPISPDAYETYLKANSYLDQFELQKSIDYYNQAIKLAPDYAPAYAHMARSYFFLGFFSAIPPHQAWGKVKEAALLATAKDDQLPEAHGALALAKLHTTGTLRARNKNSNGRSSWTRTARIPFTILRII